MATREERFVRILRRLMTRKNLTVMDVAHLCDVSRPTVQRWVDGVNLPHPVMWKCVIKDLRNK